MNIYKGKYVKFYNFTKSPAKHCKFLVEFSEIFKERGPKHKIIISMTNDDSKSLVLGEYNIVYAKKQFKDPSTMYVITHISGDTIFYYSYDDTNLDQRNRYRIENKGNVYTPYCVYTEYTGKSKLGLDEYLLIQLN